MTPAWLRDTLAALMLAVAVVSAARLAAARPWPGGRRAAASADVAHLLMGAAMAGMLAAGLAILPGAAWDAVFGVLTAWFAWQAWRDASANGLRALAGGHCAPHLAHSGSMLYMLLALAPAGHGPGTSAAGGAQVPGMQLPQYPALAFALALILAGYGIRDLGQLADGHRGPPAVRGARAFLLAPAVALGCRVAMGIVMAFMLLIMI